MKHAGVPSSYSCRHIAVRTALNIVMAVVVMSLFTYDCEGAVCIRVDYKYIFK